MNSVKNHGRSQLWSEMMDRVWEQVDDRARSKVWDAITVVRQRRTRDQITLYTIEEVRRHFTEVWGDAPFEGRY